jgi:F-type H+-transporting ATPase subunit delta
MTSIARPYAIAAFEYALAHNEVEAWVAMLEAGALMVQDSAVKNVLKSPKVTQKQLEDLFCDVLAVLLNTERKNFIKLIATNNRLVELSEIIALFKTYLAEHEKTITVRVSSVVALDDSYKAKLTQSLEKRFHKLVRLDCQIDANLIGGIIIHAGDTVIDGSVRGKLNRLREFL